LVRIVERVVGRLRTSVKLSSRTDAEISVGDRKVSRELQLYGEESWTTTTQVNRLGRTWSERDQGNP
jgi:hypothetical protein